MERLIWIIGKDRTEMLEAQRRINAVGSMRALCMLSFQAVKKAVLQSEKQSRISTPSLIIIDYDTEQENDFQTVSLLKKHQALAGVPLFFMLLERSKEIDEICYGKGAMVVLHKPFSHAGILRIERTAWQYEMTKNYEKMLQKQAGDLQAAKEIVRLNQQLKSRNDLLSQIFGRYFSEKVVEVILDHPEGAAIGGEKRELTVMMSDLRGFTALSEEMEPEKLTDLLNFYFSKMIEAITGYQGTVIELIGDGILAVFGAPLSLESQTENAVAAAITMQNYMGDVNRYNMKHGYPILEMGIGIHRGEAFIGNVGSEKMMRYNVIGSVVNECSRIESASVGGQILISKECLEKLAVPVEMHNEMQITAKGIQKTLIAKDIIGIGGEYQKRIENVEFDLLNPVNGEICIQLKVIEEKIIDEGLIDAKLIRFSRKRAVIELSDFQVELKNYSDVELQARDAEGNRLFENVYAKVVQRQFNRLTLHFTHVSETFRCYADRMLCHHQDEGCRKDMELKE